MSEPSPQFDGPDEAAIEQSIAQKLQPFVKPGNADQAARVVTTIIKAHQGPLPAPDDFAHYEHTLPGAAERIFQLAEREQLHRHSQERRVVVGEYGTRFVGQAGVVLISGGLIGLVAFTAYIGQPVTAAVLGVIGALGAGALKYMGIINTHAPAPTKPPAKQKRRTR